MSSLQSLACAHVLAQSQNSPRQNFYDEDETGLTLEPLAREVMKKGMEHQQPTAVGPGTLEILGRACKPWMPMIRFLGRQENVSCRRV